MLACDDDGCLPAHELIEACNAQDNRPESCNEPVVGSGFSQGQTAPVHPRVMQQSVVTACSDYGITKPLAQLLDALVGDGCFRHVKCVARANVQQVGQ